VAVVVVMVMVVGALLLWPAVAPLRQQGAVQGVAICGVA
jgi:hypothetical protein